MRSLLLFLFFSPALHAQSSFWTQQTSGTNANLHDVHFSSRDTGYVAGDDTLMLRTVDGGTTWTIMPGVPHQSTYTQAVWSFDGNTAASAPDFLTTLLQTSNGAQSWVPQTLTAGNPCYINGLFFASPVEGFVYGTGCFDGCYIAQWNGSSWGNEQLLWYGTRPSGGYIGITGMAKDPVNNVYIAVGDYGKIFRSTNAFQTWDTIAYNDTTDFTAVDYMGNNTFVAGSRTQTNGIYISTDGGLTFAYDANFAPSFFYPEFYDVDMDASGFGVAVGVTSTSIGGFMQWSSASGGWTGGGYYGTSQPMNAVCVIDSTRAFAVGDNGQIYRWDLGLGTGGQPEHENLAMYPSLVAAGEQITFTLPGSSTWQLDIFDAAGKQVYSKQHLAGKNTMQVNTFAGASGMYFCRAADANGNVRTGKILVH